MKLNNANFQYRRNLASDKWFSQDEGYFKDNKSVHNSFLRFVSKKCIFLSRCLPLRKTVAVSLSFIILLCSSISGNNFIGYDKKHYIGLVKLNYQ